MPLDTGGEMDIEVRAQTRRSPAKVETYMPTLQDGDDVGQALKSIREFQGLSLEEVAEKTCVRRAYLQAIEQMRLDQLPSRPFTIGYIRAYANALGLDGEAAVARFKRDEPAPDNGLPEPVGVQKESDPRLALFATAGGVILAAILAWNIAQRVMSPDEAAPAQAARPAVTAVAAPAVAGPVSLGAPLPAPVESTTPAPYETPGLAEATASGGELLSDPTKLPSAIQAQAAAHALPLPPVFTPKGAVHGAPAETSSVTLQAVKGGSVIIRGPDGQVYFARQLSAGEAYRAPAGVAGLTVDVSDPAAFQVFVAGQSRGLLPQAQTPLSRIAN
jgi:cytoskeleton protein RodZ